MKLRICMYGFVRMYVSVNHINPPNIRTFLKKIKSFSKKNKNFFKKITSFFKNTLIFFYPLSGLGKPLERLMHKGHFRKLSEEQGELLRVKALLYGLAGEPITKSGLCT